MAPLKTLNDIPTLTNLYKLQRLRPASSPFAYASNIYNDKISLIRTDITKLRVDAIVNAANNSLLGGGGVDGAIHGAAGPDLYDECKTLHGCNTGDAKITDAYELPCMKVIHAVGPVYHSTKKEGKHTSLLQGCYRKSLDLAVQNDCKSIAFSALSTGVYGYPSNEAAQTAIEEVKRWLDEDEEKAGKLERIIFCSFMEKDEKAYEEWIPKYFTAAEEVEAKGKAGVEEGDNKTDEGLNPSALPTVPTKEPAEFGQPDTKKLKTDHGADDDAEAGGWEMVESSDQVMKDASQGAALGTEVEHKDEAGEKAM